MGTRPTFSRPSDGELEKAPCLKPCGWKLEDSVDVSDRASPVAHALESLPAMQETRVPSLGREGLLEKDVATRSGTGP